MQLITWGYGSSYDFSIVKYKDNYYKVKISLDDESILGISKISIDTSTFGVQDIGDGDNVLVTPNGENGIVHGHKTFLYVYYLDEEGIPDGDRPFTSGYFDGSNYYDDSGALVHVKTGK